MWNAIISVPDHCLFIFIASASEFSFFCSFISLVGFTFAVSLFYAPLTVVTYKLIIVTKKVIKE